MLPGDIPVRERQTPKKIHCYTCWMAIRNKLLSSKSSIARQNWLGVLLLALLLPPTLSASASPGNAANQQALKVGFLFTGPINDKGWNYAHNQGRIYLENKLKGKIVTEFVENVPDNADSQRIMEKMIAHGDKLIFTTSYGLLEHAESEAAKHPDVYFVHLARPSTARLKNLSTCLVDHWDVEFLVGMVAGRMTKTDKLGFIAAHSVPQVLQTINSFVLGARSVNAKATAKVIWTNTWCDPPLEAEAAKSLIEQGVDVIAMQENNPSTIVQAAANRHVYIAGFHTDLKDLQPHYWTTGECWNWGPLDLEYTQAVLDGRWQSGNQRRSGIKDGFVKLARCGEAVPKTVQGEVAIREKNIAGGKFKVFHGPLFDQYGKERTASGDSLSSREIDNMDWLVKGVETKLATSR